MAAGHDELELVPRLAKYRDALLLAISAGIVFQLLVNPLVPVRLHDLLEDVLDHRLLVGVIEIAADVRLRDVPVVRNAGSQQPALVVEIIPIEADFFSLLIVQGLIEQLGHRLRRGGAEVGQFAGAAAPTTKAVSPRFSKTCDARHPTSHNRDKCSVRTCWASWNALVRSRVGGEGAGIKHKPSRESKFRVAGEPVR